MTFGLDTADRTPGIKLRDLPADSPIAIRFRAAAQMKRAERLRARQTLAAVVPGKRFGMTLAQSRCLDFLRRYHAEKAIMPSFAEMRLGIGVSSTATIHRIIEALVKRGYITRIPGAARAMALVSHEAPVHAQCPNCGHEISTGAQ
jgi:hypothetical protein